jgi:hypothetical protein
MDQRGEVSPMGGGPDAGARFCPRCRGTVREDGAALCAECGEALQPQGYCAVCEDFWPQVAGTPCPKHDVALEEGAPRRAEFPSSAGGPAPRWVTVRTFDDASKAEAPRIRLESEGIPTFLEGERMGSMSMYQVATGGVKLQVPQPLLADARILLRQSWSADVVDDELEDAWDELAPAPGAFRRSVMTWMILFLLFGPFLLVLLSLLMAARRSRLIP